jgi:hypothetical protein
MQLKLKRLANLKLAKRVSLLARRQQWNAAFYDVSVHCDPPDQTVTENQPMTPPVTMTENAYKAGNSYAGLAHPEFPPF